MHPKPVPGSTRLSHRRRPSKTRRRLFRVHAFLAAIALLVSSGAAFAVPPAPAEPAPRPGVSEKFHAAEMDGVPGEYLVTLADGASRSPYEAGLGLPSVTEVAKLLARAYDVEVVRVWEHVLGGFHIRATELAAQRLASDPLVARVRQDRREIAPRIQPSNCYDPFFNPAAAPQADPGIATRAAVNQPINCDDPDPRNPNRDCTENWGLDRIDQVSGVRDEIYSYNTANDGSGVHAYVIDTGIRSTHTEFLGRIGSGHNAIAGSSSSPYTDCTGHGTHVAGIIGGTVNGVAKGVTLHSVKYRDRSECAVPASATGGHTSDVMDAFNWVRLNHASSSGPAVVNFSSVYWVQDPDMVQAVEDLLAAGISVTQSAGNQLDIPDSGQTNGDACYYSFARQPELSDVIVVGGTDWNIGESPLDGRWIRETDDEYYTRYCGSASPPLIDCGSNSGPCVDLWAPAAHIASASWLNDTEYCRLSGTSMSAPHAAGAAALYLQTHPGASPAQVQAALVGGATCGALDADPSSPYFIGSGSPNLLLNAKLAGGGPAGCNQPPTCQNDFLSTAMDTRLSVPFGILLGNDSDPDGDPLWVTQYTYPTTSSGGSTDAGHVGGFNYTPPPGYTGTDWVDYTVTDRPDSSGLTATCRLYLTITATETVHAADSFTGDGPMSGRATEQGGLAWIARQGAETRSGVAGDSPAIGGLPFQLSQTASTNTLSLTARVDPYASDWVGVGFADQPTGAYWSTGELWVLVRPNGNYSVLALGSQLGKGAIPGSSSNGYHTVDVRYRRSDRLATVRINGVQVVSQTLAADPNVTHVGFHMYNAAEGGAKLDDFDLRVLGSATPILRDTFTAKGGLDGRVAEVGGATWTALRGARLINNEIRDSTAAAGVPFDVASLPGTPTVKLNAKVRTYGSNSGWNAVGFANAPAKPYWAGGELWVAFDKLGGYWMEDPSGVLVSGSVPGVPTGDFHAVEITYDTGAGTATVSINGVQVFSGAVATPNILYAGFHLHTPTGADQIDDFEVSWEP